jgi:tRNA-splicing ligase RtcB
MVNVKKISENIWEIPKEDGMLVPGRIFASDKLMKYIEKDKTLEQVKNVAHLRGILKYSMAMPDAHQGYGACVGGVAAFNLDEGIISPGAIGYDINCLTGDSKILTEFGTFKDIKDFENEFIEVETQDCLSLKKKMFLNKLTTINPESKNKENKEINFIISKVDSIFKLTTKSGFEIKSTKEHPFLTKNGMLELKDIEMNYEVAVNTFKGIDYKGRIDRNKAILAKLFGYILGDGYVNLSRNNTNIAFYGKEEDLKEIQKDITELGFNSRIISRERNHEINTKYGIKRFKAKNYELYCKSKKFALILKELGIIMGKKTNQEFLIPKWITKGEDYVKRLFLAGFFGAELSSPSTHTKTGFYSPILSQNKDLKLESNIRQFLLQITEMLNYFGVRVNKISKDKEVKSYRFRLIISAEEDNLLRLYTKIGFEYNKKRQMLADIASLYILKKKKVQKEREEIANKIKEYKSKGFKIKELLDLFSDKVNKRFVERHYYENCNQRINLDFISFSEFKEKKLKEYEMYGCIFDKVESIMDLNREETVYDFNMKDNHNFIANNIIVSNCGIRILQSNIKIDDFLKKRKELLDVLYKNIPSGVGGKAKIRIDKEMLKSVCEEGVDWCIKNGYATKEDKERTEEYGHIKDADFNEVSDRAIKRGMPQLGSLGAGNHFIEIQKVDRIFDENTAKIFGVDKDNILIMVHCGSRGFGHQIASDYIKIMEEKIGFKDLPDRELINAPFNSELGQKYYKAMCCAINYAFCNRQMITHWIRETFKEFFPDSELKLIYDVAHNSCKIEEHIVDGKKEKIGVMRKGATRAFGPGRKDLPKYYQETGQPIIIPGSMGTASYILVGTKKAEEISFATTAHGAGRVMSRHAALNQFRGEQIKKELNEKDIEVKSGSLKGLAEEGPKVYKDIDEVIEVSHQLGIGNKVVRVVPLAVMKG